MHHIFSVRTPKPLSLSTPPPAPLRALADPSPSASTCSTIFRARSTARTRYAYIAPCTDIRIPTAVAVMYVRMTVPLVLNLYSPPHPFAFFCGYCMLPRRRPTIFLFGYGPCPYIPPPPVAPILLSLSYIPPRMSPSIYFSSHADHLPSKL